MRIENINPEEIQSAIIENDTELKTVTTKDSPVQAEAKAKDYISRRKNKYPQESI